MGKVTLWIDNVQVEAEEGTSVLNAALDAGIYVPHICSHPDLKPQGGCKLCVVEIDGQEPVTSCTTTVAEGMHVKTKSDQLNPAAPGLHELHLCRPSRGLHRLPQLRQL